MVHSVFALVYSLPACKVLDNLSQRMLVNSLKRSYRQQTYVPHCMDVIYYGSEIAECVYAFAIFCQCITNLKSRQPSPTTTVFWSNSSHPMCSLLTNLNQLWLTIYYCQAVTLKLSLEIRQNKEQISKETHQFNGVIVCRVLEEANDITFRHSYAGMQSRS